MGKNRRRKRRRSDITFPKSWTDVRDRIATSDTPILKWRRAPKGRPEPRGTRLRKYGLTPEQRLAQYAPEGTTPERMVFGWLKTHNFIFDFQQPVLGGRVPGGAVVDFFVYDLHPPRILRIMSYWHKPLAVQWADEIQRETLLDLGFIVEDIEEWEINTYEKLDSKMREVLYGAPRRY